MREYRMNYADVLNLPLRFFWALNRNVDRLRAEQELRDLRVQCAAGSEDGKSITALSQALREELGSPVLVEQKFDEDKFNELAERFSGKD